MKLPGKASFPLPEGRPWLIAEAGVNHNGRLDWALRLVDAAAAAGADAVKFQTFRASNIASAVSPMAAYQRRTTGGRSQKAMLERLELSQDAHMRILRHCRRRGIEFLSTPFDEQSADFLDGLGMRVFKIASPEAVNHRLLAHVARKGKPVLLSTGACTLLEVREAVSTLRRAGCRRLMLLHCVSSYPAPVAQTNLRAMSTLAKAFSVPVGYSDHTAGIGVALAAAALGARAVEKHFTLDRRAPGPDHQASMEPAELAALARGLREVAAALGDGLKRPQPCERDVRRVSRRSIVFSRDLPKGVRLKETDLALKRPGTGLPPKDWRRVVGRVLRRAARTDGLVRETDLA